MKRDLHAAAEGWTRRRGFQRVVAAMAKMLVVVAGLALLLPTAADAKPCGDDVGGADIPCACGDVVVSDLVLGDDPVAASVCPHDGLVVRAPESQEGLTIDLAGRRLLGSGAGVGIWVFDGGGTGARIVSSSGTAVIEGYRDGIVSHGSEAIALIDGVTVERVTRDGFRLYDLADAQVRNTTVRHAGRDGYWISGKGWQLLGTRAEHSARMGYHFMGADGAIGAPGAGNVAQGSGKAGFAGMGMGHRLVECEAVGSDGDGIDLAGAHYALTGCVARQNGGDGINGHGMVWEVTGCEAHDNGNNGVVINGPDMVDGGGNVGTGNRGLKQRSPAVQCTIGREACTP